MTLCLKKRTADPGLAPLPVYSRHDSAQLLTTIPGDYLQLPQIPALLPKSPGRRGRP